MRERLRTILKTPIRYGLRRWGYEIRRSDTQPRGLGDPGSYLDARQTIAAARAKGMSVCAYVEDLWNQQGATQRVIDEMARVGCLAPCERVVEIGPGTGRYLEAVLRATRPRSYDIYEIAPDWAEWLTTTYGPTVIRRHADGSTLADTPTGSCGLVHAHGVFVALRVLHAFDYFLEMIRVCANGGYVVFDCLAADAFGESAITRGLESQHRYPTVLPIEHVKGFFTRRGGDFVHEFDHPYGTGQSRYLVFRVRSRV